MQENRQSKICSYQHQITLYKKFCKIGKIDIFDQSLCKSYVLTSRFMVAQVHC